MPDEEVEEVSETPAIHPATNSYLEFEKYLIADMPEKFQNITRQSSRKAWDQLLIAHGHDPHFTPTQPPGLLETLPELTPEENAAIEAEFPTEVHPQPKITSLDEEIEEAVEEQCTIPEPETAKQFDFKW